MKDFARSAILKVLPEASPAEMKVLDHCDRMLSGGQVPSSDLNWMSISSWLSQPPGSRWLRGLCVSGSAVGRLHGRGRDVLVYFLVQARPVGHAAVQTPDVDQVKVVERERPVQAAVVDLELAVWRQEFGLDWREVDACDFGGGVLVGEVADAMELDSQRL